MNMFRFENINALYLLLTIPALWVLFLLYRYARYKKILAYGDLHLVKNLFPQTSDFKSYLRMSYTSIAMAALVVAIANPQLGTRLEEIKREGVDVMIAIDVSNSMLAEDIKPNRLERAKRSVSILIDDLRNDRIGMVVFAGDAFLQLPLTTDFSAAKLFLSTIGTDIIANQGTAIGKAIELSIEAFDNDNTKNKTIIIISDGENHEDDAIGMAKKAYDQYITVHTIGMGLPEGAPIPTYNNGVRSGFRQDNTGQMVVSKMDPDMLAQISNAGNGKFISSGNSDPDLTKLLNEISGMEKKEFESKMYADFEDRFQYPIALAIIFLIMEFILSDNKNRVLHKLNLFAEGKK